MNSSKHGRLPFISDSDSYGFSMVERWKWPGTSVVVPDLLELLLLKLRVTINNTRTKSARCSGQFTSQLSTVK